MTSELSILQRFGGLVTLAAICSYVLALIIVPAMFAAGRAMSEKTFPPRILRTGKCGPVGGLPSSVGSCGPSAAFPAEALDGTAIATKIAERPEGDASRRVLDIVLTDRRGKDPGAQWPWSSRALTLS